MRSSGCGEVSKSGDDHGKKVRIMSAFQKNSHDSGRLSNSEKFSWLILSEPNYAQIIHEKLFYKG